jgi:hypothetical protein
MEKKKSEKYIRKKKRKKNLSTTLLCVHNILCILTHGRVMRRIKSEFLPLSISYTSMYVQNCIHETTIVSYARGDIIGLECGTATLPTYMRIVFKKNGVFPILYLRVLVRLVHRSLICTHAPACRDVNAKRVFLFPSAPRSTCFRARDTGLHSLKSK